MSALIAPDKFKGTYSAAEVAAAIAAGLSDQREADLCPIADGGDGTAATLRDALGGEWVAAPAHDALGSPIEARFAMLAPDLAAIDVAEASGLGRLAARRLDPLEANSEGTGELIAAATDAGAARVLLACGGSASTDAGVGALRRFDPGAVEIVCLCDVADPFTGALRYAPQKGAGERELAELEKRLERLAAELPHDPSRLPFTGAAGGLAGGLWAHGAKLVAGAPYVLGAVGFDRRLAAAELLITGEGRLDRSSFSGKAVGAVARRAARAGVRCHALVGEDALSGPERELFASIAVARSPAELRSAAAAL